MVGLAKSGPNYVKIPYLHFDKSCEKELITKEFMVIIRTYLNFKFKPVIHFSKLSIKYFNSCTETEIIIITL